MNRYTVGFIATEVAMLVVGKFLLNQGIHPYFYLLITGVLASLILKLIFKLRLTKKSLRVSLPTIIFFTVANSLGMLALKYSQLTNYNFLIQSSLLIMPFSAYIFLKEPIRLLIFPLALVNLAGIALLVNVSQLRLNFGDTLTLAAVIFVSLDFVWQKRATLKIDKNLVAFWRRLISSLIMGVFWLSTPELGTATIANALPLIPVSLFYVVFSLLMVRALASQPVADFNLFITLSPVLTAMAAYFLLKETLTPTQLLGAGLIMTSILVYNWKGKYDSRRHSRAKRQQVG